MLHTPSNHHHLSRVCGHGHIKKFWLMQTQKESEGKGNSKRESRGNALVASHQRSSSGFGDHCALRNDSMSPARANEDRLSIRDPSFSNRTLFDSSYQALSVPGCSAASTEAPSDADCRGNLDMLTSQFDEGVREGEVSYSKQYSTQLNEEEGLLLKRTMVSEGLCSPAGVSTELEGNSHDEGDADPVSGEGNRMKLIDFQYSNENASSPRQRSPDSRNTGQNSLLREEGKGIEVDGSTDIGSCGRNASLQAHLNIDTRSKGLDHMEFDEEEHRKAIPTNSNTVNPSSPPYRKLEGRIKGFNHIEIAERKCLEDVGMRSCTSVAMSPSHRRLHNRQRGLDHIVFDEEKFGENLQERDLSSPKVCTLCGATKTPMWRSGPQGPKSLCNACGIRYKKYRAFSGPGGESSDLAVLNPSSPPPTKGLSIKKRKQNVGALSPDEPSQPHKKSKWHQLVLKRDQADLLKDIPSAWKVSSGPASLKKIYGCMPSRLKNLGPMEEHLTVKRVFAKDEEEAAVLLMDLSCGLAF